MVSKGTRAKADWDVGYVRVDWTLLRGQCGVLSKEKLMSFLSQVGM